MKNSARNVWLGSVAQIETGAVNSVVTVALKGHDTITSVITENSVQRLGLKPGTEVLALVNAERAKENLAPLAMGDAKLQAAADERAKEVAKVASHTRPDGTNCFTVLKEYGVSDTATGENAAWGETTPEKVVADWMASEGHRVNIMDPAAKYMCLGYNYDANSQWGHNWIQIFAK